MPRKESRSKANILLFTAAPQETPAAKLALLRLEARASLKRMGDERMLSCIAKLGSLEEPNRELVIRAADLVPDLVQTFLSTAEIYDKLEQIPDEQQTEEA